MIRTATRDDIPEIAAIEVAAWKAGFRRIVNQQFLDELDEGQARSHWEKWLSVDISVHMYGDNQAGGFVAFGGLQTQIPGFTGRIRPFTSEIYALMVHPEQQGKGIGRQLLQSAAKSLQTQGHNSLALWVLRDNAKAIRFYQKMYGEVVGHKKSEISNRLIRETAYGWRNLSTLADT